MTTLVAPLVEELPDLDAEIECGMGDCSRPARWRLWVHCNATHGTWAAPMCDPCFQPVRAGDVSLSCLPCTRLGTHTVLVLESWMRL